MSLSDAKAHLRVDTDDDDDLITALIGVATDYIDGPKGIGLALCPQSWNLTLDGFPPSGVIRVPLTPVTAINSINWIDYSMTSHALNPSQYYVDLSREPALISRAYGISWPSVVMPTSGSVTVNFTCGYTTIPADIIHAAKLLIGDFYENREGTVGLMRTATPSELPLGVSAILSKYRVSGF